MMRIRKSEDRGRGNHGWLDSRHSFSFAEYYDSQHMGFGALRVINEDHVAPGGGFPEHPHKNMEIISYIVSGALEHKDSLGNTTTMRAGEIQHISAGTGITHSEYNPSATDPVHFLQIWIEPDLKRTPPRYGHADFRGAPSNALTLICSKTGRDGSLPILQDVDLLIGRIASGTVEHSLQEGRAVWVQLIDGKLNVDGEKLNAGDAVALFDPSEVKFSSNGDAHFLVFDLRSPQ